MKTRSSPASRIVLRTVARRVIAGATVVIGLAASSSAHVVSTELVTINRFGTSGNGDSAYTPYGKASISEDGRFIVFTSASSDLVPHDNNGTSDVFVRDLQAGTTTLVSANPFGTSGNGPSLFTSAISPDGRFVAFVSYASDLVPNQTFGYGEVFVRDLQTKTTRLVSANLDGTGSRLACPRWDIGSLPCSMNPQISADGQKVAFFSYARHLVTNSTFGNGEVFLRDLQTETTLLVSVNRTGTGRINTCPNREFNPSQEQPCSSPPEMSADGRYVVFFSYATDLVSTGTSGIGDIFVRDIQNETTRLVSANRFGTGGGDFYTYSDNTRISPDGRFVVFASYAQNLVPHDTNLLPDIFVRDLQVGTTKLVSVNRSGTNSGNGTSLNPRLTPDGRFVTFGSLADDLVTVRTSRVGDAFVRDLVAGTTTLVTVNRTGTSGGNRDTQDPMLSSDGRFVAFFSNATDLVPENDANGEFNSDVFVRDVVAGTTTIVSVNRTGQATGNAWSALHAFSVDGHLVVFLSTASDLVTNDVNGGGDIFISRIP